MTSFEGVKNYVAIWTSNIVHNCNLVINICSQSSNSLVLGEALAWSFSCKLVRKKMCGNMWKQRAPPNFEGGNAHPSHGYLSRVWWNKKHNWFQKFRYSSLSYIVLASTLQLPCSYLASFCTFSPLHLHQTYVIFNASSPYCIISSFYLLFLASFLFFTFCSLHLLFIASLLGLILIAFSLLHLLIIASYFQCIFSSSLYCISITASL